MGINTATKRFKEDLVNLINKSGLPPCITKMVLDNVRNAVQQQEFLAIQAEEEREVTKDAESVQPDKLGERTKRRNTAERNESKQDGFRD